MYQAYSLEGFWHVNKFKYIKISNTHIVQNLISDIFSTLQRYGSDCGISNKNLQLQKYYMWCKPLNQLVLLEGMSRDSSVGIVTCYGMDGQGFEFRCGRDFPHLSRPALGPIQPPIQWLPGLSRG